MVEGVAAEPVAATAGRKVVERPLQAVASQEPLEGERGPDAVLGLVGDRERGQLGLDDRSGVERLLVAVARGGFASAPPVVARQPQEPGFEAALVAEPAEGLQSELDQVVPAKRVAAAEQRLR
jgi:hypothetical protein